MLGIGGDESTRNDIEIKCQTLLNEVDEVLLELDTPKVSDQCDQPI
jgi:hypothetical protein